MPCLCAKCNNEVFFSDKNAGICTISHCGHVFHERCILQLFDDVKDNIKQLYVAWKKCPSCKTGFKRGDVHRIAVNYRDPSGDSSCQDKQLNVRSVTANLRHALDSVRGWAQKAENEAAVFNNTIELLDEKLKSEAERHAAEQNVSKQQYEAAKAELADSVLASQSKDKEIERCKQIEIDLLADLTTTKQVLERQQQENNVFRQKAKRQIDELTSSLARGKQVVAEKSTLITELAGEKLKQTTEIEGLKTELANERSKVHDQNVEIKRHVENVASLNIEIDRLKTDYAVEKTKVVENAALIAEHVKKEAAASEEIKKLKSDYDALSVEKKDATAQHNANVLEQLKTIREHVKNLTTLKSENHKLKNDLDYMRKNEQATAKFVEGLLAEKGDLAKAEAAVTVELNELKDKYVKIKDKLRSVQDDFDKQQKQISLMTQLSVQMQNCSTNLEKTTKRSRADLEVSVDRYIEPTFIKK